MTAPRSTYVLAALTLSLAAGCGDNEIGNPRTLWLATDVVETRVKLIDHEPPPF